MSVLAFFSRIAALSATLIASQCMAGEIPSPVFHLSFDKTLDAKPGGSPSPLRAENLSFEKGVLNEGVVIGAASLLEYATKGNLEQERGTVSLWFKPSFDPGIQSRDKGAWHCLFSEPFPESGAPGKDPRHGSGALWFWLYGPTLRGDVSDAGDRYVTAPLNGVAKGAWIHLAFTWDMAKGSAVYVNGVEGVVKGGMDSFSLLDPKKGRRDFSALKNRFANFFVGSQGEAAKADGTLDEFKIYDVALTPEQIHSEMAALRPLSLAPDETLFLAGRAGKTALLLGDISKSPLAIDSAKWTLLDERGAACASGSFAPATLKPGETKRLAFEFPALKAGRYSLRFESGCGPDLYASYCVIGAESSFLKAPGRLDATLLETIDFSKELPSGRFVSQGPLKKGSLNGRAYLETGARKDDRFAVRIVLPEAERPYLLEWDYPDDKVRTAEMLAQDALNPGDDYGLQTGVFCGDEYPNSMKFLTHRSILWARSKNLAVIFMSVRDGRPAAAGELRVYKINGALPDAGIVDAKPVGAWNRVVGIHFEDPALGYDFGETGQFMPQYGRTLDKLVAYMKWSGQNFLSYPAVWYHGPVGAAYQPRLHELEFVDMILAKFAAHGLSFMPSINLHNIPLPEGLRIDARTLSDGSLHDSPVMILSDGKPNPGGWHGTPPNFNPLHPATQAYVDSLIDALLAKGAKSPAFKGVVLHLTKHTTPWFGCIEAGYNDYNIEAFEKDAGIKVAVDRKDPLRGRLYYEWLMANARSKWIAWRCEKLAAWYKRIADRISAARPDLKLELCSYNPTITDHWKDPRVGTPGFTIASDMESGIDPKLYENSSNIILSQTLYPADYRWGSHRSYLDKAREAIRGEVFNSDLYELVKDARLPWINMHDRYFEDPIGSTTRKEGKPLQASWLKEHSWRVSTLNPNINYALEYYILPLRYTDVLGFTKGGFLIGTCGVEDKLVEFARAFRALPAVKFSDVKGSSDTVKIRAYKDKDALWLYAVNTGRTPAKVVFPFEGLTDLPSGATLKSSAVELEAYQLRSFKAPALNDLRDVKCSGL